MDAERFEQLAQAFGGDLKRWPHTEREAAEAFVLNHGETATRLLAEARELDHALDLAPMPAISADLRVRILAAAPKPVAGLAALLGTPRRPAWAPWAGLAAACAAGVVFGAAAMDRATENPRADLVLAANDASGWVDSYANGQEGR